MAHISAGLCHRVQAIEEDFFNFATELLQWRLHLLRYTRGHRVAICTDMCMDMGTGMLPMGRSVCVHMAVCGTRGSGVRQEDAVCDALR